MPELIRLLISLVPVFAALLIVLALMSLLAMLGPVLMPALIIAVLIFFAWLFNSRR